MRRGEVCVIVVLLVSLSPLYQGWQPGSWEQDDVQAPEAMEGASPEVVPDLEPLLSRMHGGFVENLGQKGEGAGRFYCVGSPLSVSFDAGRVTFDYRPPDGDRGIVFSVGFRGADRVDPVGVGPLDHGSNFFIGNDPSRWVTGARSFGSISYPSLYEGVDLRFFIDDATLKYEFLLEPFADPSVIEMGYSHVEGLSLDGQGDLVIHTEVGDLVDRSPVTYYAEDGREISSSFELRGDLSVGITLGGYDESRSIVIDPGIEGLSYLGGFKKEMPTGIITDSSDNMYITGRTYSTDFPTTPGAYMTNNTSSGSIDAFLVKVDPYCTRLFFSTLIGGSGREPNADLILSDNGSIILFLTTESRDYPLTPGGGSMSGMVKSYAVLSIISATGSSLLYSRTICESVFGQTIKIKHGKDGSIYLSGLVTGSTLPVTNGFDTTYNGGDDGYVLRLTSDCTRIVNGTYIGGSGYEYEPWLDIGPDGDVYVSGGTNSTDFPITSSNLQGNLRGNNDAFLFVLDATLSTMEYGTYLGGTFSGTEVINENGRLSVIGDGRAMVYGTTYSIDFPTTSSAYQPRNGHDYSGPTTDLFITIIDTLNNTLEYSTYFGGNLYDQDPWMFLCGDAVIAVFVTSSTNLTTTPGCYDDSGGWRGDLFFFKLDLNRSILLYGSYLHGYDAEYSATATLSTLPNVLFFSAYAMSSDFPTQNGFQPDWRGKGGGAALGDVLVGRFNITDIEYHAPSIPMNVSVEVHHGGIGLNWSPPLDAGGLALLDYEVGKATSLDGPMEIVPVGTTFFFDDEVSPGREYFYRVRANNRFTSSNWSDWINITYYTKPTANFELEATPGNNSVHLAWDAPTDPADTGGLPIEGYRLYRATNEFEIVFLVELGNVTSFLDGDVTNGQTYHYRISVVTSAGEGPLTQPVKVKPRTVPGPPVNIYATSCDGHVILNWYPGSDTGGAQIEGYRIYRGPSPDNYAFRTKIEGDVRTFNDTGLTNGQTYYYRILAYNEAGDGILSRAINVTPLGRPSAPVEPRAVVGNGTVYLHWSRPVEDGGDDEFVYLVWREPFFDGELDVLPALETSFVDYNVTNGVTYRYWIVATNAAGFGPPSDVFYATPLTLSDPPGSFVLTPGERSIELSWDSPLQTGGSPVVEFIIYRGESPDYLAPYKTIEATIPGYIDEDVTDGQTYYYMVAAVTTAGEGPATPVRFARAIGPPSIPTDLEALASDSEVSLSWSEPDHDGGRAIWGYVILRGDSEDALTEIARIGITLSYIDKGLENGRTYHYAVAAYNSIGDGDRSALVEAIPLGVPDPVENLRTSIDETTVTLLWDAPVDDGGRAVLGYVILRGLTPSDMEEIAQVGIIQSYTDEDLRRGETYRYQVAARNVVGRGELSEPVQAAIERVEEPVQDDSNWLLFVVIICACIVTVGAIASTESGRYRWGLLLGPLTTRLKREEVLDNKTRHALLGIIIANPGIHYNALMKEFDLKNGVAAYHLSVLEEKNYIRSARDGRLKRFYSTDVKVPTDLRLTPEGIREAITELVLAQPGISQKEVVNELGIDDDTVGYHLRAMVDDGQLEAVRKGKYTTYYREN